MFDFDCGNFTLSRPNEKASGSPFLDLRAGLGCFVGASGASVYLICLLRVKVGVRRRSRNLHIPIKLRELDAAFYEPRTEERSHVA
jgi:hypothetical protein